MKTSCSDWKRREKKGTAPHSFRQKIQISKALFPSPSPPPLLPPPVFSSFSLSRCLLTNNSTENNLFISCSGWFCRQTSYSLSTSFYICLYNLVTSAIAYLLPFFVPPEQKKKKIFFFAFLSPLFPSPSKLLVVIIDFSSSYAVKNPSGIWSILICSCCCHRYSLIFFSPPSNPLRWELCSAL